VDRKQQYKRLLRTFQSRLNDAVLVEISKLMRSFQAELLTREEITELPRQFEAGVLVPASDIARAKVQRLPSEPNHCFLPSSGFC
jgi:hypothetical protein